MHPQSMTDWEAVPSMKFMASTHPMLFCADIKAEHPGTPPDGSHLPGNPAWHAEESGKPVHSLPAR